VARHLPFSFEKDTPVRTLAISPCPNDTFAFYALLHGKTSLVERPRTRFEDIEALNKLCLDGAVDFCKISYGAWPLLHESYVLLDAGSAIGHGCGPLVVAREKIEPAELSEKRIAIPGVHTTAYLLLKNLLGEGLDTVEMVFDEIMPAVARGEVDAGLIIHESRFTYPDHGLVSLIDLGDWWESETGHPIPLGGIVARKDLPAEEIRAFDRALRQSVAYAFEHRMETVPFMIRHAQEMDPPVMARHVDLYVNDLTLSLGDAGRAAVSRLCGVT